MNEEDLIKARIVCFCKFHPDPDQARSALPLLREVEGVHSVEQIAQRCLRVVYSVDVVTLQLVEEAMVAAGFSLDSTLMAKMLRALYYYTEHNQRLALDCGKGESNCVQKVFVNRYLRLQHGCRDERPEHWRHYL